MELTPKLVSEYLTGWRRVRARWRMDEALTAGFVHLTKEGKRQLQHSWALISRGDDELEASAASGASVDQFGIRKIPAHLVRDWVRTQGRRF